MIISDESIRIDENKIVEKKKKVKPTKPKSKKKKKKFKLKKMNRTILNVLPLRRIINENCFAMDEGVCDYLQFFDFTANDAQEDDKYVAIYDFSEFLRMMNVDNKILFNNYPADMSSNIDYLSRRREMTEENDYLKKENNFSLKQLQYVHQNRKINENYLQIFAEDENELDKVRQTIRDAQGDYIKLKEISLEKKVKLQFKLNNPGETILSGKPYCAVDGERSEEIQKIVDKHGYDPLYISQIQPMGGISFKDPYTIKTGSGLIKVLTIYNYKKKNKRFWGERVFKFNDVVTTVDINTIDKESALFENSLNRSLVEFEDRYLTSRDRISKKKARNDYHSLNDAIDSILEEDETLKRIVTRYYLHAESELELLDKETELRNKLRRRGFHVTCNIDESEEDYLALFTSYSAQQKVRSRKGQEIRGKSLAGSYAFNYAQLIDPNAPYLGYALYGTGIVCLNQFLKTRQRKSYSGWYIGKQGFGKTSAIKKIAKMNRQLNNNTFMFMVSNEANRMVTESGGINVDARYPKINPCQIYRTDVDEKTGKTREQECYDTNLTNMKLIFVIANEIQDASIGIQFHNHLKRYYNQWIVDKNMSVEKITQYDPIDYPTYENFIELFEQDYQNATDEFERKGLYKILEGLKNIVNNYGAIFNQHSEFDLDGVKLGNFDFENLLKMGENIYNAQVFNLFNMTFSHAVKIGQREKYLVDTKQKSIEDVIFTDIVWDEFHNPIRTENLELLKQLDRRNREARKIFIGFHFAVHDINDCFPDLDENGNMGKISKAVMNLYKLSTYRFIYRQDTSSIQTLQKVLKNEISDSDILQVPKLDEGEVLLNISGTGNILFKIELSKEEIDIFDGGV